MKIVEVKDKKNQKKFIEFRKEIYKSNPQFIDNNLFMIKELFAKKTCFINNKKIYVFNVEDKDIVLCQGMIVYAESLPEYIQLCFFEAKEGQNKAVNLLIDKAISLGKKHKCKKLVVGLCGHVNYGLGLLCNNFDHKNSFSSNVNPEYYNDYFKRFKRIYLNTYKSEIIDSKMHRFDHLIEKINNNYTFKYFDKKRFDYYAKIYTDLNNEAFKYHRYYYERKYDEDKEMLKELFMFMGTDSLIFAFKNDKPVGFVMWYPDYNELAKEGEVFGAIHYIRNKLFNKKIKCGKIMEYGILEDYRKSGLVMGLLNQVFIALKKHKCTNIKTSWILEDNKDSRSVCEAICDEIDNKYVVYEKTIK